MKQGQAGANEVSGDTSFAVAWFCAEMRGKACVSGVRVEFGVVKRGVGCEGGITLWAGLLNQSRRFFAGFLGATALSCRGQAPLLDTI
jgi:hypothetical protein